MKKHINHRRRTILGVLLMLNTLTLGGCVQDIQGRPYNSTQMCWGAYQSAGLDWGIGSGCDQALTIAEDEDGKLWLFNDSCIPDGFEVQTIIDGFFEEYRSDNLCEKRR